MIERVRSPAGSPGAGGRGQRVARSPRNAGTGADALRLFFALVPDATARAGLAALARQVAHTTRGRPPSAANLHLTLAFLGSVARARLAELREIGGAAARAVSPFGLRLDRVGGFRGSGIAWAGTASTPDELLRLVAAINLALGTAGFAVETRPFHAHVTLARHCSRLPEPAAIETVGWRVDRMVLMVSETRPEGPVYREVAAWPLTGSILETTFAE